MKTTLLLAVAAAALIVSMNALSGAEKPEKLWVYIGTYTGKNSKGIYRCELHLASGKLTVPQLAVETKNPSFLAIHPNQKFLYAANEYEGSGGDPEGQGADFKEP